MNSASEVRATMDGRVVVAGACMVVGDLCLALAHVGERTVDSTVQIVVTEKGPGDWFTGTFV